MKKVILTTIVIFLSSLAMAAENNYKITIQNLTKGQPISPSVLAVHNSNFKLFQIGEEASQGLQAQAKDGATDLLIEELENNNDVMKVVKASGGIMPGQKVSISLSAKPGSLFSLSSMVARTNDAFVSGKNIPLIANKKHKGVYLLKVYDAGAEMNTESCEHIPAPPCGSPNLGLEGEGFVHFHPGIVGVGDLDLLTDTFGSVVAKVVVEAL